SFDVKANNSEDLEFSVEDIPTLYNDAVDADDDHAEPVKVVAKDKGGNEYVVPQSEIVSVKTSDSNFAKGGQDSEGNWVVYGQSSGDFNNEDKTVTLSVVFNTDGDVETITKDIVVSKDTLAASKVEFYDTELDGANVDKDAKSVSTFSVN